MSGLSVVIPVHNAFESLVPCLESVAASVGEADILVIDDASTDSRVALYLDRWVSKAETRQLVSLTENVGFVRAVNLGMAKLQGDVVLLNSDTLVSKGWLGCLENCLDSDPQIATATPWSNNGEIVSFPEFCTANPVPKDIEVIADAAGASKQAGYPDIPTAVGFCMAISRRAIDRVGVFDAETFGRGYGEENDFCMRAAAEGMRNVLCDDTYVAHIGGQSFEPLGLKPNDQSMQRLLAKHPGYLDLVMAWIREDPLASRRAAISRQLQGPGPAMR